jgi:hypothetical protein
MPKRQRIGDHRRALLLACNWYSKCHAVGSASVLNLRISEGRILGMVFRQMGRNRENNQYRDYKIPGLPLSSALSMN